MIMDSLLSFFYIHWDREPDLHKSLNDESRMTNEIRSPNVENSQFCGRQFRHSDFVIPSDFVIRHSDLRIAVCSIKRPVSGLARAAVGIAHASNAGRLIPPARRFWLFFRPPNPARRGVAADKSPSLARRGRRPDWRGARW